MSKEYLLEPQFKKSSYDEETYSQEINGKNIEIVVINFYRWCEFHITLNEKEKNEILSKNEIILSDYDIEFISQDDGINTEIEIKNENDYSKQELNLIRDYIRGKQDKENQSSDDESDNDDICITDYVHCLEENGWTPGDVVYALSCGCELTDIE